MPEAPKAKAAVQDTGSSKPAASSSSSEDSVSLETLKLRLNLQEIELKNTKNKLTSKFQSLYKVALKLYGSQKRNKKLKEKLANSRTTLSELKANVDELSNHL